MLKTLLLKLRSIIVKDDGNKKVLIKESTINNLKLIKIEDLSDEENKLILEAHKRILKISKELNNSNEVMIIVDLLNMNMSKPIFGTEDETYFNNSLVKDDEGWYVLCHNHPKCGDFSFEDVNVFLKYAQIKVITIITNNGKTKYLYKTDKYSVKQLSLSVKRIKFKTFKTVDDKNEFMEIFYKNLYYISVRRRK